MQLLPHLGSLNVYAEVRGKYSRAAYHQVPVELPLVKSRAVSAAVSSVLSRKTSVSKEVAALEEDDEQKSIEELQRMLRQERLVWIM